MSDNRIDEVKKNSEITEDMLDNVSGGYIPKDIWSKMTTAERQKAQQDSFAKWQLEMKCEELEADVVFIPEKYR